MDLKVQANAAPVDDQDSAAELSALSERGRLDWMQLSFWICLLVSIAAASVALAWPNASGAPGPILLIAMASGGLVFLLWSVRGAGRMLGLFPERGSIARAAQAATPRYGWIEALDESDETFEVLDFIDAMRAELYASAELGDMAGAVELAEGILQAAEDSFGPLHRLSLDAAVELGNVYFSAGDPVGAETVLMLALERATEL